MCIAGPCPTSKVPALPTYLLTSTLSVSSSNNEHPSPLCLQDKGHEEPLLKEMATHYSILAWKIPWPEEPLGLQSMGSQESDMTQ